MKKHGLQFLAMVALVAMLSGACAVPFEAPEDPVEYDALGRRLVTVTIDLDGADARAVNTPIAKAYINFYEVVFEREGSPDNEYYSATTTKGAGKTLSLRVPVTGTYKAYLNAGHLEDGGSAVLLAQAMDDNNGSGHNNVKRTWSFTLTALKLQVNTLTDPPASIGDTGFSLGDDPIHVQFGDNSANATINVNDDGIPYYKLVTEGPVGVTITPGIVAKVVNDDNGSNNGSNISIIPLDVGEILSPPGFFDLIATGSSAYGGAPTFDGTKLKFSFVVLDPVPYGLSNLGFDVRVLAVSKDRKNGATPIRWHIRNGLDTAKLDNGVYVGDASITNIGAGILFSWGNVDPSKEETDIVIDTGTSLGLGPS
jgi:hypothetical protein